MESPTGPYPLYATAVILPALALPAWLLCITPLVWHISQSNIAAWSLILWIILMNFFNFINPLIWPRDNIEEWYNGHGLCDVEVRVFVGLSVGLPSCTAMILRKLAKVMDTRNMTVRSNRNKVIRENALEVLWCWGYPFVMIIIYYVVQPLRYYIYGISGCIVAYNLSWVSIVLGAMWPPITICVSACYAGKTVTSLSNCKDGVPDLAQGFYYTDSTFTDASSVV
jgi:pheromone a factor receptor